MKHKLAQVFFLTTIFIFGLSAFHTPNYRIMLKTGNYYLPEGGFEEALTGSSYGGYFYRLVQFYNIPTQEQRAQMEQSGLLFFDYLPQNAYYMAIPEGFNTKTLQDFGVRSVATLSAAMKQSMAVAGMKLPDYSLEPNGNMRLILAFYPKIAEHKIAEVLGAMGISYEKRPSKGFVRAIVPSHKMLALLNHPLIYFVQEDEDPGEPENFRARTSHRVNTIQGTYPGARYFDGSGVVVSIGDDGDIGPHIDYAGRLTSYAGPSQGNHGDHVAGTVFGAGNLNPRGRGMAPGAEVVYYDYFTQGDFHFDGIDTQYVELGVRITQSSYSNGNNTGYTALARQMDEDILQNPGLNHVFSAGNAGTANHGYGAGAGWGNITGGHKQGKNVIATGNVTWNDAIASSSSRGPAHDGRIKPDVCAVGTDVFSTIQPQGYDNYTGTSMAAPGVSGALATMYQAFRTNNNNNDPDGGLMKAFLMNTADDLGNPGPDFIYGYGRINILSAISDIDSSNFLIDSVGQGQNKFLSLSVPSGLAELRVMVYWSDHMASTGASRALVNNINFTLSKDGTSWLPWVLNPTPNAALLSQPAVRAVDSLNNVEQVTIANPAGGEYAIAVNGASIPQGPQKFYVVYSYVRNQIKLTHPIGGEHFTPGTSEVIRWDAPAGTGTFTLEYSIDSGVTYQSIQTGINANTRSFLWNVPNTLSGRAMVRVARGTQNSTNEAVFSIIGRPANLDVAWVCPDSLHFTWTAVPGATGYEVSMLGQKYMDSVGITATNSITLYGLNPMIEGYLSVRALGPNGARGERANAIYKAPGTFNCLLTNDLSVSNIKGVEFIPNCQASNGFLYSISVKNEATQPAWQIPVALRVGNGAILRDTITDTLLPGASITHQITQSVAYAGVGTYQLKAFIEYATDQNSYNDTLTKPVQIFSSTSFALPHTQTFDLWNNCSGATTCEAVNCNLFNGWRNAPNNVVDEIDWRTFSGTTATAQTGPSGDNTTGNGRYLYLESSACFNKQAVLVSPCFDLANAVLPEASIYYNMLGTTMGELHVDVLADGEWIEDFVSPLIGNQGQGWKKWSLNLAPLVGKEVTFYFRGITGSSFYSDIALDDFSIEQTSSAPVPAFTVSDSQPCPNQIVTLIDQSTLVPTQWKWTITPSTFNFVGGSSDSSQNPEVLFTALGTYNIKLKVSNPNGSDSVIISGAVNVSNGSPLPLIETFDFGSFPPQGWNVTNPDQGIAWSQSPPITGSDGNTTLAAYVNHFNYTGSGQQDVFQTPPTFVTGVSSSYLVFDVAYSRRNATQADALRIDVSTDCGNTYTPTGYLKSGSALATVIDLNTSFAPGASSHWRRDSVNLSQYIGGNITLRFVAINGGGNNLYIDNINIIEGGVAAPVAQFSTSTSNACVGVPITFSSASTGVITGYTWNFGANATPSSASGQGPHTVVFGTGGPQAVSLKVQNTGGASTLTNTLQVKPLTLANFTATSTAPLTYQFNDASQGLPTSWLWVFGDGNISASQNPTHTYANGGSYLVVLFVDNGCSTDTFSLPLVVSGIGVDEFNLTHYIQLMPNPSAGFATLKASFEYPLDVQVEITDVAGKVLLKAVWQHAMAGNDFELNLSNFADGVYFIRLRDKQYTATQRLILKR